MSHSFKENHQIIHKQCLVLTEMKQIYCLVAIVQRIIKISVENATCKVLAIKYTIIAIMNFQRRKNQKQRKVLSNMNIFYFLKIIPVGDNISFPFYCLHENQYAEIFFHPSHMTRYYCLLCLLQHL